MIDVKGNVKNMDLGNLEFSLCGEYDIQTQDHLLVCQKIVSNCQELYDNISIEHDNIYGTIQEQLSITKLYQKN